MGYAAQIVRWLARLSSGLILLFICVFLIANFSGNDEPSAGPLAESDYVAISASVVLLAGLAIGWRWELLGGILALTGYLIFQLINRNVFMAFPGALIPVPAILYVVSWWIRRRIERDRTKENPTS